jgi:hypothetical protein
MVMDGRLAAPCKPPEYTCYNVKVIIAVKFLNGFVFYYNDEK